MTIHGPRKHHVLLFIFVTFFLLRRGSKIFLRFSNGSCPPSPPCQTQLTSKKQKRMLVGSCQPELLCHLLPQSRTLEVWISIARVPPHSFPFCPPPHTPTFTQSTRTHLPHPDPPMHSPPTRASPRTRRTHALQFSKHTPPKLPHARVSPRPESLRTQARSTPVPQNLVSTRTA